MTMDERDEVVSLIRELFQVQLITATGGNVCVRRRGVENEAWVTPRGMFKGDLSRDTLVRINLNGEALDAGAKEPSSETVMHVAVLRARPDITCVVHCHAPFATILVNCDLPFVPVSTEAAYFHNIGRIPFVMPGTEALAVAVVEALGSGNGVLMKNHGLLIAAASTRRASDMAQIVERSAQVMIGCHSVGVTPPSLPQDALAELIEKGELTA